MIDWSAITLKWFNKPLHISNYDDVVRKDCEENLSHLNKLSDLTFHIIPMSIKSFEYDIVTVWGEESDSILYCDYEPKPEWISLKDWENNTEN